ncbi:hypothetical protein [Apibacter muscae]|uniref:hypothetical protein n=1 Tax=Apibacter muscae TaxID=2509004 RepID=UPI001FEC3BDE|nr:hypothetical protein [Apibacter muscae]
MALKIDEKMIPWSFILFKFSITPLFSPNKNIAEIYIEQKSITMLTILTLSNKDKLNNHIFLSK